MNLKKHGLIAALMLAVVGMSLPTDADARRFGGARSSGFQRNMPARTAPNAPPAKQATPSQGQQANPGTAAAGATAAAPRRSWMGPIAGLAAGLGLAALMSHLGMGEGFANILMMVLLAGAAFMLIRFVMQRMGGARRPTLAGATAGAGAAGGSGPRAESAWPRALPDAPMQRMSEAVEAVPAGLSAATTTAAVAGVTQAFVPATFDADGFTRTAKMIFIRMQAANDSADLDDLRRFTTPEMFAAVRLDLQERGTAPQHTDVQQVEADVLDVASEDGRQIVSVRFHGRMIEDGTTNDFNEVWHLVRPLDDSLPWAIAGVEQMA